MKRDEFIKRLPILTASMKVAMEAYSAARCRGRTMQALELEPRLIAAEFVQPSGYDVRGDRACS